MSSLEVLPPILDAAPAARPAEPIDEQARRDAPDPACSREEIQGVLQLHFDAVRDELARVRSLVRDAVAKLQAGFNGLAGQVEEQDRLLRSILDRLAASHARDEANVGMRQFAQETSQLLGQFVDHLGRTSADSAEIARQIEELSGRMGDVARLGAGIKRIAQQTKMISLNAAIEAAHAGAAGAGFGVVASEVKRLAGESAELADAIESTSDAAGAHVSASHALVQRIASTDTQFAVDARARSEEVFREADSVNAFIARHVQDAANLAQSVGSSVALSVIGLQFDDIVSQLVGHLEARLEAIFPLVSASLASAGDDAGEQLRALHAALGAQATRLAAAERPAVAQESMGAGEVCLF